MSESCDSLCHTRLIEQSLCRRSAPRCSRRHSCTCQPVAHDRAHFGDVCICLVKLGTDLSRSIAVIRTDLKVDVHIRSRKLEHSRRHLLWRRRGQLLHTGVHVVLQTAMDQAFLDICDSDLIRSSAGDDVCNCTFHRVHHRNLGDFG